VRGTTGRQLAGAGGQPGDRAKRAADQDPTQAGEDDSRNKAGGQQQAEAESRAGSRIRDGLIDTGGHRRLEAVVRGSEGIKERLAELGLGDVVGSSRVDTDPSLDRPGLPGRGGRTGRVELGEELRVLDGRA
jgi:hypothetical protein